MIDRFYVDGVHSPLSNFWHSFTVIDGVCWDTIEHYYQAMKTLDKDEQERIRMTPKPGSAKRMGLRDELRSDWEEIKLLVMRRGLYHKFAHGTDEGMYLLGTGDELLIEGNDWGDTFWGVDSGAGMNWLGTLLMSRRAEMRAT